MERTSNGVRRAVVAIDFRQARVFDVSDGARPVRHEVADPWHLHRNLYHRRRNPDGTYDPDSMSTGEFFAEVAGDLVGADEVLILGHGGAKANASVAFGAYLQRRQPDVAARVVADLRCDLDDLTDNQVLRLAQSFFGEAPLRVPRGAAHPSG